jgi:hypothetical protein
MIKSSVLKSLNVYIGGKFPNRKLTVVNKAQALNQSVLKCIDLNF